MTANLEPGQLSTTLLILDGAERHALVLRDGVSWNLPNVQTSDHCYAEVAPIVAAVRQSLGLRVSAVRCIRKLKVDQVTRVLWAMQTQDETANVSADARWVPLAELPSGVAPHDERAAIDDWLASAPARTPWLRPGWRREALAWARAALEARGRMASGEPEQVRHWSIASIWRIPATGGDAWFKAVLPMFAHEGTLIELIAPSMPEHLPRVIATDRERGWTLMEALPVGVEDAAPQWQRKTRGPEWENAVRVLARLQQAWIGRDAELFVAGCTDRRLATLSAAIDELLASDAVRGGLSADELAKLASFATELPARVEALRACGVPETLMHGDFHPGNVAIDGTRIVIYDWTDSCVGHPFFDMATFLPRDPVERAALVEAYLDEWRAYLARRAEVPVPQGSGDLVDQAWELAEPLACVHHALSYMRILGAVEPRLRFEFDSDVTFWLRWLRDLLAGA